MGEHDLLLQEQIAYYAARAAEYDEWFLRQGRYDRGPELNRRWFEEVAEVRKALAAFAPAGQVLELACGTGLWTERLLQHATSVTAVDAVPEVLALNRARLRSPRVRYVQADIFRWRPAERYDVVFFAFWLSHVPPERFVAFWELVDAALAPQGRVFFVDSRYEPTSAATDHRLGPRTGTTATRRLNDGRTFRIVKVFYDAAELSQRLEGLGWRLGVRETATYFIFGEGGRRA
ncbi:MAG: class I SAM-dependent methyltransferase [Anaerolineae bacterium]|nr:class I SAM-dependent methyltransferase [Anaerolineae bacterium]